MSRNNGFKKNLFEGEKQFFQGVNANMTSNNSKESLKVEFIKKTESSTKRDITSVLGY